MSIIGEGLKKLGILIFQLISKSYQFISFKSFYKRSKCDPNGYFFWKITKIAQRLGTSPPNLHGLLRLEALPPGPGCDTLHLHHLVSHYAQFFEQNILTLASSPPPLLPKQNLGCASDMNYNGLPIIRLLGRPSQHLLPHRGSFSKKEDKLMSAWL